jgi:hypothetical protein
VGVGVCGGLVLIHSLKQNRMAKLVHPKIINAIGRPMAQLERGGGGGGGGLGAGVN